MPFCWFCHEAAHFQVDRKRNYTEIAKHTYDATMERTRTIEEVIVGVQKDYFDVLRLHKIVSKSRFTFEPRHEKTCLRGLRPGKTQISLRSYRS